MKRFLVIFFLLSSPCFGQAWSGILPSSRAINWTSAGLPASFTDEGGSNTETTPNPWTPPTRTQFGSTISPSGSASTDLSNINAALSSCTDGTYVLLGSGTFLIQGTVTTYLHSCTLRGSGAQSTILAVSGSGYIALGSASGAGSCLLTSGSNYSVGSTTLTCNSQSGLTPVVGNVATLTQCDTGYSGEPSCTGTASDNGGVYVCGQPSCSQEGTTLGVHSNQAQTFRITSVSNVSGTYTIGVDTGLYMANWAYARTPLLSWQSPSADAVGSGLEDVTVYMTGTAGSAIYMANSYASWIKGVRIIGSGSNCPLQISHSKNDLVANSYFFPDVAVDAGYPPAMEPTLVSDSLIINNFMMSESEPIEGYGGNVGDVAAYNFARDSFTLYSFNNSYDHVPFDSFELFEGNEFGEYTEDNTWGTHALDTYFRNTGVCYDAPYTAFQTSNSRGFQLDSYQRFINVIGNAFGTSSQCSGYQGTGGGNIFEILAGDSLAGGSLMRWGNVSTATQSSDTPENSGIRFVSAEVPNSTNMPSGAYPGAVALQNFTPSNDNIPCSFFLPGYTSAAACSTIPSGGTGLSWWTVCIAWTTFPTNCSATQTQPFPTAGPDVSGGPYVNGHAYDSPAEVAWKNLPVDTTYQHSYGIASSSWSGGTETLTFNSSALPNVTHLMGAFQLSGVNSACTSGATFNSNGEILITRSSSTTVQYALASNPGVSCTGSMKFPDVRQFDERVYQSDGGGLSGPPPPDGLNPPTDLTATVE